MTSFLHSLLLFVTSFILSAGLFCILSRLIRLLFSFPLFRLFHPPYYQTNTMSDLPEGFISLGTAYISSDDKFALIELVSLPYEYTIAFDDQVLTIDHIEIRCVIEHNSVCVTLHPVIHHTNPTAYESLAHLYLPGSLSTSIPEALRTLLDVMNSLPEKPAPAVHPYYLEPSNN